MSFLLLFFLRHIILLCTNVACPIGPLQKDSSGILKKGHWCQIFFCFGSEIVNYCYKKKEEKCFCHALLMDLDQDQQQHPAVHYGGVSRGRVRGCGC